MTNKKQIMEAIPSEQVDNALAMIKVLRRAMEMYPNEKELQAKLKDRISKLEKAIKLGMNILKEEELLNLLSNNQET